MEERKQALALTLYFGSRVLEDELYSYYLQFRPGFHLAEEATMRLGFRLIERWW